MRVRTKLLTIILFVALVPLLVSAFTALRVHRDAYLTGLDDLRRSAAASGASLSQQLIDDAVRSVQPIPRSMSWAELSDDERDGALWLTYQQLDAIQVVSLFDDRAHPVGASVYLSKPSKEPKFAQHAPVSDAYLQRWVAAARNLLDGGKAVRTGALFRADDGKTPVLPVAVAVAGKADGGSWTATVAVSLARVCDELARLSSGDLELSAIASGRRLCVTDPSVPPDLVEALGASGRARYNDGERDLLVASHRTKSGWIIVAQQPASTAEAPSRRMRNQTIFWIAVSVIIALAAGLFLAGGINRPVARLAAGAEAVAGGDLEYRIEVDGGDELGDLARTFNHMGEELQKRNAEIERWNLELQDRVEERTRELREAQDQLLQAKKLAAVTSLAAGVAHEINNPLTGVLGLCQLLIRRMEKLDDRKRDLDALVSMEREAKRIRDIVQTLLGFARQEGGEGFEAVDCGAVIDDGLGYLQPQLDEASIEVKRELASDLRSVHGGAAQLRQVVINVVKNAITAMKDGGTLTVGTASVGKDLVKITIADTGSGIPPENLERVYEPFFTTKEDWQGRGLGLSVAFQIIEQHNGSIKIDSEVGEGTTVVITLPAGSGGAHLV